MTLWREIKDCAEKIGYDEVGVCSITPFVSYAQDISERWEMYSWTKQNSLETIDLICGSYPSTLLPGARCIIVAIKDYFQQAFPQSLVGKVGRVYQRRYFFAPESEEQTKRQRDLMGFIAQRGYKALLDYQLPARLAASRSGLTTFGRNTFAYSHKGAGSWIGIDVFVSDVPIEGKEEEPAVACEEECQRCLKACPTGALYEPLKMNPTKCIAYLSYLEQGAIPLEVRPKMGSWIYGCDVCQQVCPRNEARLKADLPPDYRLEKEAGALDPLKILSMDQGYFEQNVLSMLYYIRDKRYFQRNAAIALGNSGDERAVPALIEALHEPDSLVRAHVAWALGRLDNRESIQALKRAMVREEDPEVQKEIELALTES